MSFDKKVTDNFAFHLSVQAMVKSIGVKTLLKVGFPYKEWYHWNVIYREKLPLLATRGPKKASLEVH